MLLHERARGLLDLGGSIFQVMGRNCQITLSLDRSEYARWFHSLGLPRNIWPFIGPPRSRQRIHAWLSNGRDENRSDAAHLPIIHCVLLCLRGPLLGETD